MSSVILEQDPQRTSQHWSALYHGTLKNCQVEPDCVEGVGGSKLTRRKEFS